MMDIEGKILMEDRVRRMDQKLILSEDKYLTIRVSQNNLNAWKISQCYQNNGWLTFQITDLIRKGEDHGEDAIVSAKCVSFLTERNQSLEAQFILSKGAAWERILSNSRQDICVRERHADIGHPHNSLDYAKMIFREIFSLEIPPEVESLKKRIQAKIHLRKSKSVGNLSSISDSLHLDDTVKIPGEFRRINICLAEASIVPTHDILKAYLKKEENVLYRIFQFQVWLGDLTNSAYRRLLLTGYNEIDIDLVILHNYWTSLCEEASAVSEEPEMKIVLTRKTNPVILLGLWFLNMVKNYNQKILEMSKCEMLSEELQLFEDVSTKDQLQFDEDIGTRLHGTIAPMHGTEDSYFFTPDWMMEDPNSMTGGVMREDLECTGGIMFHRNQLVQVLAEQGEELLICSLDIFRQQAMVPTKYVNTNSAVFAEAVDKSKKVEEENSLHSDDPVSTDRNISPKPEKLRRANTQKMNIVAQKDRKEDLCQETRSLHNIIKTQSKENFSLKKELEILKGIMERQVEMVKESAIDKGEIKVRVKAEELKLNQMKKDMTEIKKAMEDVMSEVGNMTKHKEKNEKSKENKTESILMDEGELNSNLKFLHRRIKRFQTETTIQCDIVIREDTKPSIESSKIFKGLQIRQEKLQEQFETAEGKLIRLRMCSPIAGKRQEKYAEEIHKSLNKIETIMEVLKEHTVPDMAFRKQNFHGFKLSALPKLVVDKIVPGSTLFQWIDNARDIQKKNSVEDSIMLEKMYRSMDKPLMQQIKSKNPKSISDIENNLYIYGLPIPFSHNLEQYHKGIGKLQYPINKKNASRIKRNSEAHLMGITAAFSQIDYYKRKFGDQKATNMLEQGTLSNGWLYGLASCLPDNILQDVIKQLSGMDSLGKISLIKMQYENLLSASENMQAIFGSGASDSDSVGDSDPNIQEIDRPPESESDDFNDQDTNSDSDYSQEVN